MAAVFNDGRQLRSGQQYDFEEYSPVQATVMPVAALVAGRMHCLGTAVCIGAAGWFLTARHVVQDFLDTHGPNMDGTSGLFVMWETDVPLGTGPNDYLGAPLPVTYCHPHSSADLATLTVAVDARAADLLRVATLSVRMPRRSEPLAAVGYRTMSVEGEVAPDRSSTLTYERTLTVSVGDVLETQHARIPREFRGSPGLVTNAPMHHGMSGGPIFDRDMEVVGFASSALDPTEDFPEWNSYAALCGPALELDVMGREHDDSELKRWTLAELVAAEAIACSMDGTVDVVDGRLIYPAEPAPDEHTAAP